MDGSVMELFQIQVKETSKRYRVIYVDKNNKRMEVVLDNFSGKFVVVQSLILDEQYVALHAGDHRIVGV